MIESIKYILFCMGTFRTRVIVAFLIGTVIQYFYPSVIDTFVIHESTDPMLATLALYCITFALVCSILRRTNNKDSSYDTLNLLPVEYFYVENKSVATQLRDCKKFLGDTINYNCYNLELEIIRYYEVQGWSTKTIHKPIA